MRFESNFLPKSVKGGLHQNKCFLVITILQACKIARNNEYDYCGYIQLSFKTRIRRMLTQIRRIRLSGLGGFGGPDRFGGFDGLGKFSEFNGFSGFSGFVF